MFRNLGVAPIFKGLCLHRRILQRLPLFEGCEGVDDPTNIPSYESLKITSLRNPLILILQKEKLKLQLKSAALTGNFINVKMRCQVY